MSLLLLINYLAASMIWRSHSRWPHTGLRYPRSCTNFRPVLIESWLDILKSRWRMVNLIRIVLLIWISNNRALIGHKLRCINNGSLLHPTFVCGCDFVLQKLSPAKSPCAPFEFRVLFGRSILKPIPEALYQLVAGYLLNGSLFLNMLEGRI